MKSIMNSAITAVKDYTKLCKDSEKLRKKFCKDHPIFTAGCYAAVILGTAAYSYVMLNDVVPTVHEADAAVKQIKANTEQIITKTKQSLVKAQDAYSITKTGVEE